MKKYTKPETTIQQFHPSEYIAATCATMYMYELGQYTFVSTSPEPVFEKNNDDNGDGFWKAGNSHMYKFSPDDTNYLLINGEQQTGHGTITLTEEEAMSLQVSGTTANHS